jgi:GT2 family glycosyltransferase
MQNPGRQRGRPPARPAGFDLAEMFFINLRMMRASVVVCTRNRSSSIAETLAALARQDYPRFEFTVVDSSSGGERENTARIAREFGAKYLPEPRPGLSLARNTGIAAAAGEIIAFTDDDCIPAPDWLARSLGNFADPEVWACTGRVLPCGTDNISGLFEQVAGQDLGKQKREFRGEDVRFGPGLLLANAGKVFAGHMKASAPAPFGIGHGSSLMFRRAAFENLGGFNQRFGAGAPLKGCDDIEMLYRVLKSGHKVVYEPAATVLHKHRLTSGDDSSADVRNQSALSLEEVYKTRYAYSFAGAAMLREFRENPALRFMLYGRLLQLLIKSGQYKLTGKTELAKAFAADLRGFLAGWAAQKKLEKTASRDGAVPAINQSPVG